MAEKLRWSKEELNTLINAYSTSSLNDPGNHAGAYRHQVSQAWPKRAFTKHCTFHIPLLISTILSLSILQHRLTLAVLLSIVGGTTHSFYFTTYFSQRELHPVFLSEVFITISFLKQCISGLVCIVSSEVS